MYEVKVVTEKEPIILDADAIDAKTLEGFFCFDKECKTVAVIPTAHICSIIRKDK
jgi:hypothetical protein